MEDPTARKVVDDQLLESSLGSELTAVARRLAADTNDNDEGRGGLREAADGLMESTSFKLLSDAVECCSLQLPPENNDHDNMSNKRAKQNEPNQVHIMEDAATDTTAASPPHAADPTSFSLFDLLDSQKGGAGFALPPRITAQKIIEAYQREQNDITDGSTKNTAMEEEGGKSTTTLELLEKADDMEDLSPDGESWEEVRNILYKGLLGGKYPATKDDGNSNGFEKQQFRYLEVHKSLAEKCRGNNICNAQLWSLVQNLVGSMLTLTRQFAEDYQNDVGEKRQQKYAELPAKQQMDLCWDIARSILDMLSQLAVDYVVSCVGNEREVERMLLGIALILSDDFGACIFGMMEPMAGTFEVWSRLVDPKRVQAIIGISGLGGVALRRCESLGGNVSSECIWKMIHSSSTGKNSGSDNDGCTIAADPSLADIEHCNFIQSLSILRTILFRCGGSKEVVSLLYDQFTTEKTDVTADTLSSFLLPHGVANVDVVQTLLEEAEEKQREVQCNQTDDAINSILKPFHRVMQVKESNAGSVDSDLEVLCRQTIQLLQQS